MLVVFASAAFYQLMKDSYGSHHSTKLQNDVLLDTSVYEG